MLARIRKAAVAGFGAGVAAGIGALTQASPLDRAAVSQAIGTAVVAAAAVGWTTWRVPNKATA